MTKWRQYGAALVVLATACTEAGSPAASRSPVASSVPATASPTVSTSPTEVVPPALTRTALRNAALPPKPCGREFPARPRATALVDGRVPGTSPQNASITVRSTATGDLDGDGVADGAVLLGCHPGGNGYWFRVLAYTAAEGFAGFADLAKVERTRWEPAVRDIRIADGRLVVRWSFYDGNDPRCCPTHDATGRFAVAPGSVRVVSHTVADAESTIRALVRAIESGDDATARRLATPAVVQRLKGYRPLGYEGRDVCGAGDVDDSCMMSTAEGWLFYVDLKYVRFGVWRAYAVRDFGGGM